MQNYYLGLDMGTNSVGWAVTDPAYKLLRAKGKDLWGIREFDEAQPAAECRSHRVARRRRQRQQVKIGLLKSYFQDAIFDEDPAFYIRLENSKYHVEDKDETVSYEDSIFHDKNYTDKDYFAEYPTIFHLRKALMDDTVSHSDKYARFVFLALLNMFKHRGHFLNASISDKSDGAANVYESYLQFRELLEESIGVVLPEKVDKTTMEKLLSSRDLTRTSKLEQLADMLAVKKSNKQSYEFLKAICGLSVDTLKLFPAEESEETERKSVKFSFSDSGYDEKLPEILEAAGSNNAELLEAAKQVHDNALLAEILKGYATLSEARIASYKKHKKDLSCLKRVIRRSCSQNQYDKLFRSDDAGSYSAYVNSYNSDNKMRRNMKERGADSFYASVMKLLKPLDDSDKEVEYIREEIAKNSFMPKQLTSSNGVIPNQVHAREMKRILGNAQKHLPFLLGKDDSGLTVSERIMKLFSFQVPYYVGPVTENSSKNKGNGWVIRKSEGEVLPWNMEERIDLRATSEKFIERLVRECTYITGQKVLPKASLLYEKYAVLNEINMIQIRGERIPVELKQEIYCDLFESGKKVTRKALVKYLMNVKSVLNDETELSGIDIAINNSLSTFGKFYALFGEKMREDSTRKMIEDIIFWCTVYGDSKKYLKEQLTEHYGEQLTEEQIKKLLGFKFKDWGRLSREFLELPGCEKSTGEIMPLIQALWKTNMNSMELINSDLYTYKEELAERTFKAVKPLREFRVEDLDDYYFSAPVRRMVWQTLQIIQELEHILGCAPEKVFVEMARQEDEKKKRIISRKNKFTDLYNSVKTESSAWRKEWKELIAREDESGRLRSKKMYLYLTQQGKCMSSIVKRDATPLVPA